ncbi:acetyl-CoA synthetase-like protein [Xylaria bambusicola]|uniref:acetyl-CoA synthetase-like protein n=1 Tax=Xylaria bambusicola TaxID=326684 RepID=UPI0020087064|nr:acetyl-CoA synthetase-like protein [Xylaria bambusicola]KAI0505126.1 acetyl-CoA synthetase-like protein [Xylaria bambusicola]
MAHISSSGDAGRLLPVEIDEIARNDPQRPWASIPMTDNDLSRGYEDISYEVLANAINKLAWIIDSAIGQSTSFESMAYLGITDLRYHMMQMAACKTGHQVLFSSHLNSLQLHLSLMERLNCGSLFYSEDMQVDDILTARSMTHIQIPTLDELINIKDRAKWYPYTKTYEEVAQGPYLTLHTSGTTGTPKLLIFNHEIIRNALSQNSLPDVEGRSHVRGLMNPGLGTRFLMPTSPFHVISSVIGMCFTVFGGGVLVLPYRSRGMSVTDPIFEVFTYSRVKQAIMMPYTLEAVAQKPNPEDYIKIFERAYFGGGELSPLARETWAKYTRIQNCWGSSELGFPPQLEADPEDSEYVYFDMEHSGIEFREIQMGDSADDVGPEKLYEMVHVWSPKTGKYSTHFARERAITGSEPPYQDFHVGDLWTPHPDRNKSGYVWRFAGRKDDLITLGTGLNVRTAAVEEALLAHDQVKGAIMVGNKRLQPLVVLELVHGTPQEAAHMIWKSVIEPLNAKAQSHARIASTHILVVPAGGLVRTPKGTISKVKSERKLSKEIEEVYWRCGDVWQADGRPNENTV